MILFDCVPPASWLYGVDLDLNRFSELLENAQSEAISRQSNCLIRVTNGMLA
jgi:hypothetical protein